MYGEVRVKDAYMGGRLIKSAPEYEDASRLAKKHGVPLREVIDSAQHALRNGRG